MFPPYPIDFVRFPLYPFECSRLLRLILFVSRFIQPIGQGLNAGFDPIDIECRYFHEIHRSL